MNAWWHYISHEIDVSKEFDGDFNFPKTHLISHWVEQIHRYRALQQISAERHEKAQNTNLKDSWNTCNQSLNYLPQVITFQCPILCCSIRELNLQALAQRQENSAGTWNVLPSSAKWNSVRKSYANLQDTPVPLTTSSKYLQMLPAPLELCKVLSYSARAFPWAPKTTWSDGGVFRML